MLLRGRNYLILLTLAVSLVVTLAEDKEDTVAHGLGEKYDWVKLDDAFDKAKELNHPIMLIIHKSWCGACRSLKPKFARSESILELSKHFVMVNTLDDEEPKEEIYKPGGAAYIPRILFFNNLGEIMTDVTNEGGNSEYPYYYYDDEGITASMKTCLTKMNIRFEEKEKPKVTENDRTEL